jgi:hypothetical protein
MSSVTRFHEQDIPASREDTSAVTHAYILAAAGVEPEPALIRYLGEVLVRLQFPDERHTQGHATLHRRSLGEESARLGKEPFPSQATQVPSPREDVGRGYRVGTSGCRLLYKGSESDELVIEDRKDGIQPKSGR